VLRVSCVGQLNKAIKPLAQIPSIFILPLALPSVLTEAPGAGPFTIQPVKDLPFITRRVTINGYSQPGASVNTLGNANGNNANLRIILSGSNYTEGNAYNGTGNGLIFVQGSGGSVVKGLVINGWVNTGIYLFKANNVSINGNYIGTNNIGTTQVANQAGIFIDTCNNTVIGTSANADRNIIAGSFFLFNASACIVPYRSHGTKIKNNYIGVDKTGTVALGNSLAGVTCLGSSGTVIGGTTSAERNIISGHTLLGLSLESSSNNQVLGNYIGTDKTGTVALGNLNFGLVLNGNGSAQSTTNNMIKNNLISGNRVGIKVGQAFALGSNGNIIRGNLIGTDATGASALGNQFGIIVNDNTNSIGGGTVQARNIISGNIQGGVLLYGAASGNSIKGNYIGLNKAGNSPLANGYGIQSGAAGGMGAAGSNTIMNNLFGGGNSSTTLCV